MVGSKRTSCAGGGIFPAPRHLSLESRPREKGLLRKRSPEEQVS
jgi:hypothetical protein